MFRVEGEGRVHKRFRMSVSKRIGRLESGRYDSGRLELGRTRLGSLGVGKVRILGAGKYQVLTVAG